MSTIKKAAGKILAWSYERGTIQYDIMCALILAFIFLIPPSCFVAKKSANTPPLRSAMQSTLRHCQVNLPR